MKLKVKSLSVDSIQIDAAYQREFVKAQKWRRIASDFRPESFGVLTVAVRDDGSMWCVDGQHRLLAAKAMGFQEVDCSVFASRGQEHEARVFLTLNTQRTAVLQVDVYRAALSAGEKSVVAIESMLREFGLQVSNSSGPNNIKAAAALGSIYAMGVLGTVLDMCRCFQSSSGEMRKQAYTNTMLHTVAEICNKKRWDGEIDLNRVKKIFSQMTYQEWRTIEQHGVGTSGDRGFKIAKYFVENYYNKHLIKTRVYPKESLKHKDILSSE